MNKIDILERINYLRQQKDSLEREIAMLTSNCNHINVNLGTTCRCIMCGKVLDTNIDIDATEFMMEYDDNKFKVIQEILKSILTTNNHILRRKLIYELNQIINPSDKAKINVKHSK